MADLGILGRIGLGEDEVPVIAQDDQVTILGRDTDGPLAGKEDHLRDVLDHGPNRTALADRIVEGLPDDPAILLIQCGKALSRQTARLDEDTILLDQRRATVTVRGTG